MRRTVAPSAAAALGLAVLAFAADQPPAVPERVVIGALANLHPPVELDHAAHAEIAGDCSSCHHRPFGEPAACSDCHERPVTTSAFVHDQHQDVADCTGCHHRPSTADLRCVGCHPVEPAPDRLGQIGLKGAYHGLCLGCHAEADAADSCASCHPTE